GDLAEETVYLPADDVLYAGDPPDGPPDGSTGGSTEGRRVTPPGRAPGAYLPDGTPDPGGQAPRPRDAAQALSWISSGAGVTILPMSLARLHHRKDVTHRVLADGPTAPVGLVWLTAAKTDLTEEMIGIVRGRTVNSSRGVARPAEPASGHAAARPGSGRAGSRRQPPSRSPQGRSDQRQANQRQANRGRGNRGRG
ncbi:MAG: hypothetical protein FWG11_03655, partial [Promicromonosporaceae bacterium]|nr:hypothetical protein [Promicromonosporaceae bacterium]